MIPFNSPPCGKKSIEYLQNAIENKKISGDGFFTKACNEWLEEKTKTCKALLTTSCTHALEMAALLCDIEDGDEVIMPSYTFVSTANAFSLRGAKIVFVDVRPDTMNIDESLIQAAITKKTKVIVPVHYAGIACEMDRIISMANDWGIKVVEDAAQGVMSSYKQRALGSIGDFGCFSFHETKNFSMGEGGALLINNPEYIEKAEIIREKGTDRSKFFRGQVDKYTWVDIGSSYLPSELNAAYLFAQFEMAEEICKKRLHLWDLYEHGLTPLKDKGYIELPVVPEFCSHNGHLFYIKLENIIQRTGLIEHLLQKQILSVFHYIPLHSAPAGLKYGVFHGEDRFTTKDSERLLRLPLFFDLSGQEVEYIIGEINNFFK